MRPTLPSLTFKEREAPRPDPREPNYYGAWNDMCDTEGRKLPPDPVITQYIAKLKREGKWK